MENKPTRFENLIGFVVIVEIITGIAGLLAAGLAIVNAEWIGTGLCLAAAALAFGLVANAILRK